MQLDPGTAALAATTLSLLAPCLQTGAEEFAKSAGKSAFEQVQKLLARIRKQFEPDSEAKENLAQWVHFKLVQSSSVPEGVKITA
jgi:hypothetical protein